VYYLLMVLYGVACSFNGVAPETSNSQDRLSFLCSTQELFNTQTVTVKPNAQYCQIYETFYTVITDNISAIKQDIDFHIEHSSSLLLLLYIFPTLLKCLFINLIKYLSQNFTACGFPRRISTSVGGYSTRSIPIRCRFFPPSSHWSVPQSCPHTL